MECNNLSSRVSLLENYQSRGSLYSFRFVEKLPSVIDIRNKTSVFVVNNKAYIYAGKSLGDYGDQHQWKYVGTIANEIDFKELEQRINDFQKIIDEIKGKFDEESFISYSRADLNGEKTIKVNDTNTEGYTLIEESSVTDKNIIVSFYNSDDEKICLPYTIENSKDVSYTSKVLHWYSPVEINSGDIYFTYIIKQE